MASLNWQVFENLRGGPRENWELLCREVVRRHYDQFGSLLTRRQQPGVEFHLELLRPCPELGPRGSKWGWQCKWFDPAGLKQDNGLRAHQRRSVEESIGKSLQHIEGLTDWVLWTRQKLTADDLRWFESLQAPFVLRHWDEETLIGLLSGPAEPLRATWFGELVLDEQVLAERRREALAPIRQRYIEELHLRTRSEAKIDELLLGAEFELELSHLCEEVELAAEEIDVHALDARQEGAAALQRHAVGGMVEIGQDLRKLEGRSGNAIPPVAEIEAMAARVASVLEQLDKLANALDRRRPSMLVAREARSTARSVHHFLRRLAAGLHAPLVVVLGSAGAGKTHLAASISGPDETPSGLLVLGRQFGARISDDDLSRYAGLGADRDELLEALEALGVREGRRIPLVIDGINESEDPAAWQIALSRLEARLSQLEHILLVVTLRPTYRGLALPAGIPSIELDGFLGIEEEAVRRYFAYYKIDASAQSLEWWRPSDPLLLSIFCRTINPERKAVVGAADLPASLAEVLDNYLQGVCEQVGRAMEITAEEIEGSLHRLAWCFYQEDARELDREEVSQALGDRQRAKWKESLRFHLEAEEVLIRDVIDENEKVMWSYDLLAGHVIAHILLRDLGLGSFETAEVKEKLQQHPLREDIVAGLVGLLGTRSEELFATFQDSPDLCFDLVQASVHLPAAETAASVAKELPRLFAERPKDVLDVIEQAAVRSGHPLNARALDRLLFDLQVRQRDMIWTEWFRHHSGTTQSILRISETWRQGKRTADDEAAVAWLSWALTSPREEVRDASIQALYRIGKREPEMLFRRALQMLRVNDPAVGEGTLAAAYGVVMACQLPARKTIAAIVDLASELQTMILDEAATPSAEHWLVREYAYRIVQFAAWISDGVLAGASAAALPSLPSIANGGGVNQEDGTIWKQIQVALEEMPEALAKSTLLLTLTKEVELLGAAHEVADRVANLGWSAVRSEPADRTSPTYETGSGYDYYLQKYVLQGLYEAASRRSGSEEHSSIGWRLLNPPLDPSFPESARAPGLELPKMNLDLPNWFAPSGDDNRWLEQSSEHVARELLHGEFKDGTQWIAIDGKVSVEYVRQRQISIEIHGILAIKGWHSAEQYLRGIDAHVDPFPLTPPDRAFAGEAPWSPTFDSAFTTAEGDPMPRIVHLGGTPAGPSVERLSVPYGSNVDRSTFNTAEIGNLPAKFFAQSLGLRKLPNLPDFVDEEGRPAARPISFRGVDGLVGHMLYMREDLLDDYAQKRSGAWGWFITTWRTLSRSDSATGSMPMRTKGSTQTLAFTDLRSPPRD